MKPASLKFNGTEYFHRWSKDNQHEFTPANQSDLKTWKEMVTIHAHENITTGEQLAELANGILGNYQSQGKVLRTASQPRTETRPAEHLIVAALGTPTLLEAVFARLFVREGVGMVVIFSHRIYGKAVGPAMSTWLKANGPKVEKALLSGSGLPTLATLKQLPQSKG